MSLTTQVIDTETGAPVTDTLYTPYACAKVVNEELARQGYDLTIRPQMFYNYVRQSLIATVEVDGQKLITETTLATWLHGYLERKAKAAAKKTSAIAQA